MPQIAYDFNEASDLADFVVLEPGNYVFKFTNADGSEKSKAGNPKVIIDLIVVAVGNKSHRWAVGGLVRQHMNTTGGASGRFRDFLAALGATPKAKGTLKLEKFYEEELGARVTKVPGKDLDAEGNPVFFNDLRQLMPGDQMRDIIGDAEDEDIDDEDEDVEEEEEEDEEESEEEDEEDDEEAEDDEDEEEEEDEDEDEEAEDDDEEEEELTLEDLKGMKLADLRAVAEANEVSLKPPKGGKLTAVILRKRLEALFDEDEEEGEEDPF